VSMKIKNSEGAKVMEKYLMVSKSRSWCNVLKRLHGATLR
jgi:hypothetical protein